MLYFQNDSWLQFQGKLKTVEGGDNAKNFFGIENIPVENHIKTQLDKIKPCSSFKKVYDDILLECERLDIIKQFVFMEEYLLVAVDGVQYHSSQKVKCQCCQTKKDSKNFLKIFTILFLFCYFFFLRCRY